MEGGFKKEYLWKQPNYSKTQNETGDKNYDRLPFSVVLRMIQEASLYLVYQKEMNPA